MANLHPQLNLPVTAADICALRRAVGWSELEADYPAALNGYWATVGVRDEAGRLVGWGAILSDGVRHAVLLDVIVHPARQRQGLGRRMLQTAIDHCRRQGITLIHVDFTADNIPFYRACGFQIGLGGLINLESEAGPDR